MATLNPDTAGLLVHALALIAALICGGNILALLKTDDAVLKVLHGGFAIALWIGAAAIIAFS